MLDMLLSSRSCAAQVWRAVPRAIRHPNEAMGSAAALCGARRGLLHVAGYGTDLWDGLQPHELPEVARRPGSALVKYFYQVL